MLCMGIFLPRVSLWAHTSVDLPRSTVAVEQGIKLRPSSLMCDVTIWLIVGYIINCWQYDILRNLKIDPRTFIKSGGD
jgi:hypothetical protein